MKNHFSKIAGLSLGIALAIGVGAGIGTTINKKVTPVHASTGSYILTFDANTSASGTGTHLASDHSTALTASNVLTYGTYSFKSGSTYYWLVDGSENVASVESTANCYPGANQSIKVGKSAGDGTINFTVAGTGLSIDSIVVTAYGSADTAKITIDEATAGTKSWTLSTSSGTHTFTYGSAVKTVSLTGGAGLNNKNKVAYITRMEINYTIDESSPTELANPNPQYNDSTKLVSWTTDANATKYQVKVDSGEYADINTETYNASVLTTGEEHTVYIKAVGDGVSYSSTEGHVTFTPTAPFVSKDYVLCTSVSDLEAGAKYIFTNGTSGSVKAMSSAEKGNNRDETSVTVDGETHRIASTQSTLVLELGGSSGAWTFHTENYAGTDGYFGQGNQTSNNYLKIYSNLGSGANGDTWTISFSENAAVITSTKQSSRNVIRYNSNLFSCYTSGYSAVYLWKEYKELTSLNITGTPTKLTGYYDSESFDPTGITAYQAEYSDGSTKALLASDISWPSLTSGMTTIRGSYTESGNTVYTPTYNISVSADSLSSVSLSGTMTSSYYTTDGAWDEGDLVVTANYASGSHVDVTSSATFAYYSNSAMTQVLDAPSSLEVGNNQTIYVKATYNTVSNTTGYAQTVSITIEHGTIESDPLTVAEAATIGNALEHNTETSKIYYIQGVISEVTLNELSEANNWATIWLQNGEAAHGFEAYHIKPAAGCTNYEDLKVGADVLIKTKIKRYNTTIENGSVSSIESLSYAAPSLTGIILNKASLFLEAGGSDTLTASPSPAYAELSSVKWLSSKTAVATVNQSGNVSAVAAGHAKVTAFVDANDNGAVDGGEIKAVCNVYVGTKATMEYSGATTVNMTASDNADLVGLDDEMFEVDADKGSTNNLPGLNKDGDIRLYGHASENGSYFVVSLANLNYKISAIKIDFKQNAQYASVYAGETLINGGAEYIYGIDGNSFKVQNTCNGTSQVQINSVEILYSIAAKETIESTDSASALKFNYEEESAGVYSYSQTAIRFGACVSQSMWAQLDRDYDIQGYGVLVAANSSLGGQTIKQRYAAAKTNENTVNDAITSICSTYSIGKKIVTSKPNPAVATSEQKEFLGVAGDYYIWTVQKPFGDAFTTKYNAVAFILIDGDIVFLEEVSLSAKDIATRDVPVDDQDTYYEPLHYMANMA